MTLITFPIARAKNRHPKLYRSRGDVVQLRDRTSGYLRALGVVAGALGISGEQLTQDFNKRPSIFDRYMLKTKENAASRAGHLRALADGMRVTSTPWECSRRTCAPRYRGGDTVMTRDEGYFGTVIAAHNEDEYVEGIGATITIVYYEIDFDGVRQYLTADKIKSAARENLPVRG